MEHEVTIGHHWDESVHLDCSCDASVQVGYYRDSPPFTLREALAWGVNHELRPAATISWWDPVKQETFYA